MRVIDEQGRLLGRVNLLDGAAIFLGLFSAVLLLHFSYHNFLRHTMLTLEEATPKVFVPGVDRSLAIQGNGFKEGLQIKIDGQFISVRGVNEARVDVQLPDDLTPGYHQVQARNPGGRMVSREDLFRIRWEPVVETITLKGRERLDEKVYRITGKYFDPSCVIRVDGAPVLRPSSLNPQEVLITVPAASPEVWTELSIQNPSGGGIILGKEELLRRMDPARFPTKFTDPKISRVIPGIIQNRQETGVLILGHDLKEGCAVRIGDQPLKRMEWFPPHAVSGSLPAHSLIPGENPVEVVNPGGKKATASVVVAADAGWVDVELFFPELSRKDLKKGFAGPGLPVQILTLLDRRGKAAGAYAEVRLPVEIRGIERDGSTPLCYYENKLLRVSQRISFSLPKNRVVSAEVRSLPKRVQQETPPKDSR